MRPTLDTGCVRACLNNAYAPTCCRPALGALLEMPFQASAPQCCAMARQVGASCKPHRPCRPVSLSENNLPVLVTNVMSDRRQVQPTFVSCLLRSGRLALANIAGSGKTYTLLGEPGSFEQRGLAARTVHEVHSLITQDPG